MAFAEPHPGLCCPLPSPWDTGWHGGGFPNRLLEVSLLSRASQGSPCYGIPVWGSHFHLNPRAMEPRWLSVDSPQPSWFPCLSYACGCFHVQVLSLPPMRRPSLLPKEPFPLSWIHFFSAQPTRGKCQAGSCLAFIWLWPGPPSLLEGL